MAALSGTWTLKAIQQEAGWKQGILISGSVAHDGIYEMVVGTEIQNVSGDNLILTPQAFDPVANQWIESLQQERMEWDDATGLSVTIFADDNPTQPDGDFNDLVVRCLPEDAELSSPLAGLPRPDLTIPDNLVRFSHD